MQMGLAILQKLPELLRESDWKVTALLGYRGGTTEVMEVEPGDTSARHLGIALDVGTTTVVAHLVDLRSSETLATKAKYNSQISLGDDVISRIMYSKNGERLKQLRDLHRQRHQRPDHRVGHGCQGQVSRRRLHRLRRQHDDGPPPFGAQPGEHPPRTLCALRDDAAGHPGRRDRDQDQPAGPAHGPALRFKLRRRRRGRRRPGHRHDRLGGPLAPDRPRHERGAGHRKLGLAGVLLRLRGSLLRRGRDHLRHAGDDGRHRAHYAHARRTDRRVQRRGRRETRGDLRIGPDRRHRRAAAGRLHRPAGPLRRTTNAATGSGRRRRERRNSFSSPARRRRWERTSSSPNPTSAT